MSHFIAPSILSADFNYLKKDIELINDSEADLFHVDVMDGVFVPNISFGFPIIEHVKKISKKPLDVHLMIMQPDRYITEFAKAGADYLTVHYEACNHLHRTIDSIKSLGMKAGVALNPHTSINLLEDVLKDLDMVLVMSVNPGFGGQKFIEHTYAKVSALKELLFKTGSTAKIEVDGGVSLNNYRKLIDCGADILVAGNAVFKAENPMETISLLKK
jgi:ribulose-phosphate 3-epimerase